MAPISNPRILFEKIPTEYPVPGETTRLDKSPKIDLDKSGLQKGQYLVKSLVISVDPFLRPRMRDPSIQSYVPAFKLGAPIYNFAISLVLKSEHPKVKVGDYLYLANQDWELYSVRDSLENTFILSEGLKSLKLPWSQYLSICGMPGQTAYFGWKYAEAKKGETSSDQKVQFLKELGADVAFNYKTTSTSEILKQHGPINIYWDHVGGEVLETAIDNAAEHARILLVGAITEYNRNEKFGIKNLTRVMNFRHVIRGVFVGDELQRLPEFYKEIPPRVASGGLELNEQVYHGLESSEQALVDVLKGQNTGKVVVKVGEDNLK